MKQLSDCRILLVDDAKPNIDILVEALKQALANVKSVTVDPTKPELYTGMLNTGHTFGDGLSEEQRLAVLEFLKCL